MITRAIVAKKVTRTVIPPMVNPRRVFPVDAITSAPTIKATMVLDDPRDAIVESFIFMRLASSASLPWVSGVPFSILILPHDIRIAKEYHANIYHFKLQNGSLQRGDKMV